MLSGPLLSHPSFQYTTCAECPVGRAAGLDEGRTCPFMARRHAAHRILYLEGEPAGSVWFVRSGAVVLYRAIGEADVVQTVRRPGSFVGLEAVAQESYTETARIAGSATLCGATRDVVATWLGPRTPARAILLYLLEQLAGDAPRPSGSARSRVARWLLIEAEAPSYVPRHTVARLLDIAPETLSRILRELDENGSIETGRRAVKVLREGDLARLAGS